MYFKIINDDKIVCSPSQFEYDYIFYLYKVDKDLIENQMYLNYFIMNIENIIKCYFEMFSKSKYQLRYKTNASIKEMYNGLSFFSRGNHIITSDYFDEYGMDYVYTSDKYPELNNKILNIRIDFNIVTNCFLLHLHIDGMSLMKKPRKKSIKIKDIEKIDKLIDSMVDDYMKNFYEQIAVIKNKLTMLDDISLHNLIVSSGKYYNLYHSK